MLIGIELYSRAKFKTYHFVFQKVRHENSFLEKKIVLMLLSWIIFQTFKLRIAYLFHRIQISRDQHQKDKKIY